MCLEIKDIIKKNISIIKPDKKLGRELVKFIRFIEKATGKKAIKKMMPMAKGDVLITYANVSKATTLVGYRPQVTLEDGINKFVKWYKNN